MVAGLAALCHGQVKELRVFAAASLKESASDIALAFEARYPQTKVQIEFGGTQQLAAQIREGAPADVLLGAGMEPLKGLDYVKSSLEVFATNRLTLVAPLTSRKVRSLEDLNTGVRVIIADWHVPCGFYTDEMLQKAARDYGYDWRVHVDRNTVSKEQDVRAVLAKVELGEADAGIVYMTDYLSAKSKLRVIPIPAKYNVEAVYPAVRFPDSPNPALSIQFLQFLEDPQAGAILARHGFSRPARTGH